MPATSFNSRLLHEIEHGKKIAADAEDVWNWSSPAGKVRADRRANYICTCGNFTANGRLLEIGCGTGIFTEKVFHITRAKITAIDISPELLELAKKKLPEVDFRIADAMATNFPDDSFDGVYGSSVIHHLEYEPAFREIYRVLKKGGRMVFAEPNMLNPQIFLERHVPFLKKMLGVSPDESAIVRWKTKSLLRSIGFSNVSIFPYDFLHPATPRFIIGFVNSIGMIAEKVPLLREIAGSVIISAGK
ncbi:MAG: class I SAM-dependent methyltransferase [Bacteroidetes bacterium]|nr:class I SAM-dependent methyltransferase [Bacteroidota bacterium]